jgi:ribosomal protein L15
MFPRPASAVARGPRARPLVGAPRALARARTPRTGSRAGRCRCICGCPNRFRTEYQVVNLDRLAELFPAGGAVGVDDLVSVGAVRKGAPVKVLGSGELGDVRLEVRAHAFSASAREKLTAAGGTATVM